MKKNKVKRWLLGVAVIAVCGGTLYWFFSQSALIVPYNGYRDRAAIWDIFNKNHYWLDVNESVVFAWRLDEQELPESARTKPLYYFAVYREKGITKGFVTYHMLDQNTGKLLYLAVDEKYRGHGIARLLEQYALKKLESLGAMKIITGTRSDNLPAQKLYETSGFKREAVQKDPAFVDYELILKPETECKPKGGMVKPLPITA